MNSKIKKEDDGIICYKGFDKELKCRDFQFEIGKTYTEPNAKLCECGFHACTNPIDVFRYYPPSSSRYCRVKLYDLTAEKSDDSKCVGKSIQIINEIGVNDIISEFVAIAKKNANTGNHSAATNTGDCSAATNTGDCSAATNTGNYSAATNTGNYSAATNTGYYSAATVSGKNSIAIAAGKNSKAAGEIGCAICVVERGENGKIIAVKAAIVDGEKIKANVFYTLKNGEFSEIKA